MTSDHEDVARAMAALGGGTLPYRTFRTSNSILAGSSSVHDDASEAEASDFPLLAAALPGSTALLRAPPRAAVFADEQTSDFSLLAAALPESMALLPAPGEVAVTAAREEAFQAPHLPSHHAAPAAEPATGYPHRPGGRTNASGPPPPQDSMAAPALPLSDVFRVLRDQPASVAADTTGHDADLNTVFKSL